MFKSVNTPIIAKPMGTSTKSNDSSNDAPSSVTLSSLGGMSIGLLDAPNGVPKLTADKKLPTRYIDQSETKHTVVRIASAAINAHRVVCATLDGTVSYGSNKIPEHIGKVIGISTNSADIGEELIIQTSGLLSDPSFSFTEGLVWVGDNGYLVTVPPGEANAKYIQQIGIAVDEHTLLINVGLPFAFA